MPDITPQDFIKALYKRKPEGQRIGQWAFNALHDVNPDLAYIVRDSPVDPFYQDERLNAFLAFILENW